ncbi:hypothetical protein DFQ27_006181 [Actinomortierella ambigua]|uniref:Uncharacterized protein n=1 Tax=Actinomortierella ambigua TaxID=1343610 RepID=A0A9P6Q043_9FUNG|nr:hypothetical protein DFQ27_006181 [Actinomortierella ambigua]
MPKRHINNSREGAPSKRLTPEDAHETPMDEAFALSLTKAVFGRRPSVYEKSGIQYIVKMRLNPQPTTLGFLSHMETSHPQSKAKSAAVWKSLKDFFNPDNDTAYSEFQVMVDTQALVKAFQGERYIEHSDATQPGSSAASASVISKLSSKSGLTARSRSSGDSSRSSSNSSSHSTLSAGAISKMRSEYDVNFAAFKGEPWSLASGTCVDDIVGQYVRGLVKESALHSFVIDFPTTVLNLFQSPEDKEALSKVLMKKGWGAKLTNPAEEAFVRRYNKEPAKVVEVLSHGWSVAGEGDDAQVPDTLFCQSVHLALHHIYVVYSNHQFTLPEKAPESFYVHTLWGFIGMLFLQDKNFSFRTAEAHSYASFLRKNKGRKPEESARQAVGRKVDGLVISRSAALELCVMEAASKDAGPFDTKALGDTRKISKVLKDSFDAICAKATKDISSELVVFGLRIAGRSLTFYTMRRLEGRLYQLCTDGTVSFPLQWDESTSMTILTIVASMIALRKRISETNDKVKEWVGLSFEILDASDRTSPPSTLTTPPGSPRLSPRPSPSSL